jgi:hypothetical protein
MIVLGDMLMSSGMIKRIVIPRKKNLSYVYANQRWRSWSSDRTARYDPARLYHLLHTRRMPNV